MKKKIVKFLNILLKNILVFLLGGLGGVLLIFLFLIRPVLERVAVKSGLAIIALGPIVIILYSILSFIVSGLLTVIAFNLIKIIKKIKW